MEAFGRRDGERPEWHRALLLYASQDPDKRSVRAVARAVVRDESTVRGWRRRWDWDERIKQVGPAGQSLAIAVYRRRYLPARGSLELEVLRPQISLRLTPDEPATPQPLESVSDGSTDVRTGNKTPGASGRNDGRIKEINKRIVLADAMLATFAKQLASGDVNLKPADLPMLSAFRDDQSRKREMLSGGAGPVPQMEIPESFRVKHARAGGGDVLGAIRDDAQDLALVLTAITNQRSQEAHEAREA
jgi:hypothetical protein